MKEIWVGDTVATCHMVCSDENLTNWRSVNQEVTVAGGSSLPVTKIGSLKTKFKNTMGKDADVFFEEVKYVLNLKFNLFSMTFGMRKGWKIESFNELLTIRKNDLIITFHHKIPVGRSFLSCAEEQKSDQIFLITSRKQYDFKKFHDMIGHASIENSKITAAKMGIKLTGKIISCEDCLLAKMKRKNINKLSLGKSKIPGERILIDISYIKRKSLGGKDTWLLIEDQATNFKWSYFMRRKVELMDEMIKFIKTMISKNPESIKFIRLDNAGENLGLKSRIELEGLDIKMEYTNPETPEQNGQVERSFATLWGKVRFMLNRSVVTQDLREKLWAECASTGTKLNNIISRKDGNTPFEKFSDIKVK
jgi:hypothetical protein